MLRLADFQYDLPSDLIAQYPLPRRGDSRLLCLDGPTGACQDRLFQDLPRLLHPGDLLVFNDTRVVPARLHGHKETGGRVEVLVERFEDAYTVVAHLRASKTPRPGTLLVLGEGAQVEVLGREEGLYRLRALTEAFTCLLEQQGHMPLPPYINRSDEPLDQDRYQTVYARHGGAVAAPTAGLHFEHEMLARLQALGIEFAHITLHVGAGTFKPVRTQDLDRHQMHRERLEVSPQVCQQVSATRARGGRVVAVGTTSVRSLETAAAGGELNPYQGDTRLFIRPGYGFRVVDALITNFHLPESTLLMLVAAFAGHAQVMNAYQHAVEARYRFFSYGDVMFLTRRD